MEEHFFGRPSTSKVGTELKYFYMGPSVKFVLTIIDAFPNQTTQELRMLSSVTINCQVTKIVMNSGSQLSEL